MLEGANRGRDVVDLFQVAGDDQMRRITWVALVHRTKARQVDDVRDDFGVESMLAKHPQ